MNKGIIYSFIISLVICLIMPFTINADASDGEFDYDSVVGVQVEEYEELLSGVQGTRYKFNIILDGFYVGNFNIHVEYDSYNVSTSNWDHLNIDRTVYVCGYDTYFETWMRENWLPPSSITWSASVNNSDQCIYVGRMESQQLLNLLIGLRSSYNTNSAVTNGFLNQIDLKIDELLKKRQWNIYPESYSYVLNFIKLYSSYYEDFDSNSLINYPVFNLPNYSYLGSVGTQDNEYVLIFGTTFEINSPNIFVQKFVYNNTLTIDNISLFRVQYNYLTGSGNMFIYKVVFNKPQGVIPTFRNLTGNNLIFIPVYLGANNNLFSTEFALIFGLKNELLNDLDIIANGTQQSQSAAGDLEQGTSNLASDISSYNQIESDYNNQMNQALNNIDFSDQFSNNQNFLSGASFVKTVFNSFMQIDILRIFFIVLCIVLIAKRFI